MSFITAGAPSKILTDARSDQIEALLSERPCEAVATAKRLLSQHPDDERVLALCLRTALRAQAATGQQHMSEDLYAAAAKAYGDRFFSPVFCILGVAAAAAQGRKIDEDHLTSLGRAIRMGPEVSKQLVKEMMPFFKADPTGEVMKVLRGETT